MATLSVRQPATASYGNSASSLDDGDSRPDLTAYDTSESDEVAGLRQPEVYDHSCETSESPSHRSFNDDTIAPSDYGNSESPLSQTTRSPITARVQLSEPLPETIAPFTPPNTRNSSITDVAPSANEIRSLTPTPLNAQQDSYDPSSPYSLESLPLNASQTTSPVLKTSELGDYEVMALQEFDDILQFHDQSSNENEPESTDEAEHPVPYRSSGQKWAHNESIR